MDILISWKTTPSPVHNSQTPHKHLNGSWMFVLPLDMDIEQLLGISWDIMKNERKNMDIPLISWKTIPCPHFIHSPSYMAASNVPKAAVLLKTSPRKGTSRVTASQGVTRHASPGKRAENGDSSGGFTKELCTKNGGFIYDLYGILWIFDFREKNQESRWFSQQNIFLNHGNF